MSLIFVYFSHASSVLRRDITVSQKLFHGKEKSLKCPMDRKRHKSLAMELFRVKRKRSLCPEIGRAFSCIITVLKNFKFFFYPKTQPHRRDIAR